MKYPFSLIMLFLFFATGAIAQTVDEKTQKITYQEVVEVPGSKEELFNRGMEWVGNFYKNPNDVCRIRDKANGIIEIAHRIEMLRNDSGANIIAGIVNYNLKIEFKDGRYRYTITDFVLRQASRYPVEKWLDKTDPNYSPLWDDYLKQVDTYSRNVANNLKENMVPKAPVPKDEW